MTETEAQRAPGTPPAIKPGGVVRTLIDYGGIIVFALAYFLHLKFVAGGPVGWMLTAGLHGKGDLVGASWWLVGGSAAALLLGLAVEKRLAPMPLVAGGFALVFGILTVALHDPTFVKIKPTVTNLVFAAALFGGLLFRRNPLAWMMGDALPLPEEAWRKLTFRYGVFFLVMAVFNEIVRRTQSDKVWFIFHFPGLWLAAVIFSLTQVPLMMKYLGDSEAPPPPTES